MKTWTDVVLLPMVHIEEIVCSSNHTKEGYTKHQAVLYGLLLRILSLLTDERRLACKRLINYRLAAVLSRMIMATTIKFLYLIQNENCIDSFCKASGKADKAFMQDIYVNRRKREVEGIVVDIDYYNYEEGLLESAKSCNRSRCK